MNIRFVITKTFMAGIFAGAIFLFVPAWAQADVLGQRETFFVNKTYDQYARTQLDATLRHVSDRLYFYADDKYWNQLTPSLRASLIQSMQILGSDFDTHIYPQATAFWGSDPQPGIDGDPRITILLEALTTSNGGYFDSIHTYAREPGRDSNEREMISLNMDALPTNLMPVFLGHEFQHLISSYQKGDLRRVNEEVWLNELRSEYTATLLGQNSPFESSSLSRRLQTFLRAPSDSLIEWANLPGDYGIAAVFAEYLTGRYGSRILSESAKSSFAGITSLNDFLSRNNVSERFSDIFIDWMVASYFNDRSSSRYGYTRPELQGIRVGPTIQKTLFAGAEIFTTASIKYWQPTWMEFFVGDNSAAAAKIDITGQATETTLVAALAIYTDGTYEVQKINFAQGKRIIYIPLEELSGKKVQKIMLATTYGHDAVGSVSVMPAFDFSVKASLVDAAAYEQARASETAWNENGQMIPEGSLIKHDNAEPEAYVTWGSYKRYLRPEIITLYGHLDPSKTIPVNPATFNQYAISNYVRVINDKKVYAIWPDGTKHWLNIPGEQFTASGRDWNAIFTINEAELNAYRTGVDIIR